MAEHHLAPQGLALLGDQGSCSIEKLLLTDLAAWRESRGGETTGVAGLYRDFLRSFVGLDVDHQILASLDDDVLGRFYNEGEPTAPPRYFRWKERKHLAYLENVLGVRLIIARPPDAAKRRKDGARDAWVRYYDGDRFDRLVPVGDEDAPLFPRRFYAVVLLPAAEKGKPRPWALFAEEKDARLAHDDLLADADYFARDGPSYQGKECHAWAIATLHALPPPKVHACDWRCTTIGGLAVSCKYLRSLVGSNVLVALHESSLVRVARSVAPSSHEFAPVATLADEDDPTEPLVVVVDQRSLLYRPKEAYAASIRRPPAAPKSASERELPPGGGGFGPVHAGQKKRSPSTKRNYAGACCNPCDNADAYAENLAERKPQRLFRTPVSTFDLLKVLGLDEHRAAVLRCCQLSNLCYDVESCTELTRDEGTQQEELRESFSSLLSPTPRRRRVVGTQRQVLIGFTTARAIERGRPVRVLESEPGQHRALGVAFAKQVLRVRKKACALKLELLAPLLAQLAVVKEAFMDFFRREGLLGGSAGGAAFLPLPYQEGDEPWVTESEEEEEEEEEPPDAGLAPREVAKRKRRRAAARRRTAAASKKRRDSEVARIEKRRQARADSAWRNTVFGWLEHNLVSLTARFVCWGFNSRSYDLPMLLPSLATYFKARGLRKLRVQREGTKVLSLTVDGTLTFQEVLRLLPAGMSLDKFREMCELREVKKMIFPFALLDASQTFLDQPQLPPDASAWRSRLTNDCPTQEAVDEARQFFAESGFQTVRDYLSHYLRADVTMLALGVEKMRATYHDLFDLDLVDSAKFTISSLSALASQTFLARAKRLGMFAVNDRKLYSILRQGIRGGLTATYRTVAGRDADYEPYVKLAREQWRWEHGGREDRRPASQVLESLRGINAHLLPPPHREATHLSYLDVAGLYSYAATRSLPYGSATLFTAVGDGGLLERDSGVNGHPGAASQESVFVQYLAWELFPQATRCFSDFTAGPGQSAFGGDAQQRADVLLTVPEDGGRVRLLFANYHGAAWHGNGAGCVPGCPKLRRGKRQKPNPLPERRRQQQVGDGEKFVRPQYWPGTGGMVDAVVRVDDDRDEDAYWDDFKRRLAGALTEAAEAARLPWRVTYDVLTECQLQHDFEAFDGREALGSTVAPVGHAGGLAELLRRRHADKGPLVDKTCQGLGQSVRQEDLVARLLSGPDNSEGGAMGGFLLLCGGRQTDRGNDPVGDNMGYCLQRVATDAREAGAFSRFQAHLLGLERGEDSSIVLDRHCQLERTVTRKSFPDSGELVGADLFRWLVRERGLRDFTVRHYVYYAHARHLTPFLEELIQARHDLRRSGHVTEGVALKEALLKLALNAIYGQACMEATNFPDTRVMTMGQVAKNKLLEDGKVTQLTLLGALEDDLVYAVTKSASAAKIKNLTQMAASILSDSRVVFLGYLSRLADLLDPARVEKMYVDTDSVIFAMAAPTLEACLRPGADPADLRSMMEDPGADEHQGGKLRDEGTYTAGRIKATKQYDLVGGGPSQRRMKSFSRRAQAELSAHHFGQDPRDNRVVAHTTTLRPTLGLEMTLQDESRTSQHGLNLSLKAVDCVHTLTLE